MGIRIDIDVPRRLSLTRTMNVRYDQVTEIPCLYNPERSGELLNNGNQQVSLQASGLECVRDDRTLFSDLDFRLEPKQALVLEGRNGSGKTTLLRTLCGIRMPEAGSIHWCDEDIFHLGPDYHEHIVYVGHRDGMKLDLTPLENLEMARALGRPRQDQGALYALEQVGLAGFEDVPTRNLSAGQQRRLALARLLVTQARLWILDEPFTSLDKHGIVLVEEMLGIHLSQGGMLAMTSHHSINLIGADMHRIDLSA